jgi:5-methylcytosine-specific restriction endonuclease McrBC regulatory subunit McrC
MFTKDHSASLQHLCRISALYLLATSVPASCLPRGDRRESIITRFSLSSTSLLLFFYFAAQLFNKQCTLDASILSVSKIALFSIIFAYLPKNRTIRFVCFRMLFDGEG